MTWLYFTEALSVSEYNSKPRRCSLWLDERHQRRSAPGSWSSSCWHFWEGKYKLKLSVMTDNKYIDKKNFFHSSSSCSALTRCSAWPQPGSDRPWPQCAARRNHRPHRPPVPQPNSTPSSEPARHTGVRWSCGWSTTEGWRPAPYATVQPSRNIKVKSLFLK